MTLIAAVAAAWLFAMPSAFASFWRSVARRHRRSATPEPGGLELAARLLLVATSSGLPLAPALTLVAGEMHGPVAAAIEAVVRRARPVGIARALVEAPADLYPLNSMLARAAVSGASVRATLEAFLDQHRRAAVGTAVARARRASVLLVVPLALLLLPGFALIVFGPVIAHHLELLVVAP